MEEFLARLSFNADKRIRFYSMMRDFVTDGIPVYEVFKSIEAASAQIKLFPPVVINDLMTRMRGSTGRAPSSLGEALGNWVEPVEAALIDAGQRAGRLEDGLKEVIQLMEAKARVRSAIISSMSYPFFLLLALGGFLWFISSQIIPTMASVLPRPQWPGIAQILGGIADNSSLILGALFGVLTLVGIVFAVSAGRWVGAGRDFFDRYVMPWSTYCQVQAAMVLTALSMMVEAGVPVGSAITQLHNIGSEWLRHQLEGMQSRMRRGLNEAEAIVGSGIRDSIFDPETAWEIRMYGARTSFARSMKSLALRSITRLEGRIRLQSTIIRNILLFVVAGMLALTFSSFMSITMNIGKH